MNNINSEENAIKLKEMIMEIEEKACAEVTSSRGLTSGQSRGFVDSSAVSAIVTAVEALCEGDE